MAIVIKKKAPSGAAPDPVVSPIAEASPQEPRRYVDVDGSNYENLIRALARRAALADHMAENPQSNANV